MSRPSGPIMSGDSSSESAVDALCLRVRDLPRALSGFVLRDPRLPRLLLRGRAAWELERGGGLALLLRLLV